MATEPINLDLELSGTPLAATAPPEVRGLRRDQVKLLVLNKETGETLHARFHELPNYLSAGDVLVVNTSATIPAKLIANLHGQWMQIHLATKLSKTEYIVERRTEHGGPDQRAFASGDGIDIYEPKGATRVATVEVTERFHPNSRLWRVQSTQDLFQIAHEVGLPIRYSYVPKTYDVAAYQTIFARHYGSAEMPSAARPFTRNVLKRLALKGVNIQSLILHTGVSSHEVEHDLEHHPILPEWYEIPDVTARAVNQAKSESRRVIAVGTTVIRALESAVATNGEVRSGSDWTTHIVTPDSPPKVVSGLVTGLHESQTSHLALLYSLVQRDHLRAAYQEAILKDYLWHEFGDSNLIL